VSATVPAARRTGGGEAEAGGSHRFGAAAGRGGDDGGVWAAADGAGLADAAAGARFYHHDQTRRRSEQNRRGISATASVLITNHAAARVACLQEERTYARIKAHSTGGAQGGVDAGTGALDTLLSTPGGSGALAAVMPDELQVPIDFMIRTEDEVNRNAGESQSLIRFWSRNIDACPPADRGGRGRHARWRRCCWSSRAARHTTHRCASLSQSRAATAHRDRHRGCTITLCLNDAPCPPFTSHGASITSRFGSKLSQPW
jgi:hypothetical protein